jgi:carbohydrate diacid regulator
MTGREMIERLLIKSRDILGTEVLALSETEEVIGGTLESTNDLHRWIRLPFEMGETTGFLLIQEPEDAERFSPRLVEGLVNLLAKEVSVLDALPMHDELKNEFVHRLLDGSDANEEDLLQHGQRLGMDLSRPRAVLLIDASSYIGGNGRGESLANVEPLQPTNWLRTRFIIRRIVNFFSLPSEAICAYIGGGVIAVLKASTSRDLQSWVSHLKPGEDLPAAWSNLSALKRASADLLGHLERETGGEISIGVGRYHPGITGLSRSYRDAKTALSIGKQNGHTPRVFCLDSLGMAGLIGITEVQTRQELARHILGPLDNEPELLQTLGIFFEENCSVASTSSRLFVHRNTLNYRLDKIASLTGLDPKMFEDAMLIRLALMLRSLTPSPVGQLPN